jgi:hypothetical protein
VIVAEPGDNVRWSSAPAVFVRWNVGALVIPGPEALAVHVPVTSLAAALVEATPEALVVTDVAESMPPAPGPDETAKTTAVPGTGLPNASATVTLRGLRKAVPTCAD